MFILNKEKQYNSIQLKKKSRFTKTNYNATFLAICSQLSSYKVLSERNCFELFKLRLKPETNSMCAQGKKKKFAYISCEGLRREKFGPNPIREDLQMFDLN